MKLMCTSFGEKYTDAFTGIRNAESNNEVMSYTTCLNCIDINVWLPGAIAYAMSLINGGSLWSCSKTWKYVNVFIIFGCH